MAFKFIAHHLISGCIPMTAAWILYSVILCLFGKKRGAGHMIASFVFCMYLIGVLTVTGICIRGSFSPRIVYIPFVDMIRGPVDTALNILLFVPLGFFLPILFAKYDKLGTIALAGFLLSLSVELIQMFGFGATDINDLMTNTAGACLGYGIYKLLRPLLPESGMKQIRAEGIACSVELPLFWSCAILLMLTIQPRLCRALFTAG